MDRCGVRRAVAMPTLMFERPNGIVDTRAFNDLLATFRDTYRERFPVALGIVDPPRASSLGWRRSIG